MEKPKKKFFMSPYLLVLSTLLMAAVIGSTTYLIVVCIRNLHLHPPESGNILDDGMVKSFLYVLFPGELFLAFLLYRTYEVLGRMEIQGDAILFRSTFRGKRKLLFSEIKYIGIDYGVLSGGVRQFWIYFSKERIPPKYIHHITHMPLTKQTMRIQYSQRVFDALVYYLPKDLSKRLRADYSVIRLYKVEDD